MDNFHCWFTDHSTPPPPSPPRIGPLTGMQGYILFNQLLSPSNLTSNVRKHFWGVNNFKLSVFSYFHQAVSTLHINLHNNYCTLLKIIFYCRNNSRKKWKIKYEDVESCIAISTQIMPWLCLQGQEIDRNWYTTVMKHRYENSFTHLLWPRYFSSSARSTSWTCTNSFHSVSFTSNQLFNTLIHFSIFHYSTLVFSGRPA